MATQGTSVCISYVLINPTFGDSTTPAAIPSTRPIMIRSQRGRSVIFISMACLHRSRPVRGPGNQAAVKPVTDTLFGGTDQSGLQRPDFSPLVQITGFPAFVAGVIWPEIDFPKS